MDIYIKRIQSRIKNRHKLSVPMAEIEKCTLQW